jgi:hypothetical protein
MSATGVFCAWMRPQASPTNKRTIATRYLFLKKLEFVQRLRSSLRDGLAETLIRESVVCQNHSCLITLLEELHNYSRDGLAKFSVVGDPFRLDDLVVLAGKRKFPGSGDVHFLGERTAHTKIHFDLALRGRLAAIPLLQLLRLRPPGKHKLTGSVEDPRDLEAIA